MSNQLRSAILLLLNQHHRSSSPYVKADHELAATLGVPVANVQRQLDILASDGYVQLAKTMGPSYGAWITPKGMAVIDELSEPARRPIGFGES